MSEYIREDKATIAKSLIDLIGVCSKYEGDEMRCVIQLGDIYLQCHFEFKEVGQKKKISNADRIRNMPDDELAAFLCELANNDEGCDCCAASDYCHVGHVGFEDWLRKEAK